MGSLLRHHGTFLSVFKKRNSFAIDNGHPSRSEVVMSGIYQMMKSVHVPTRKFFAKANASVFWLKFRISFSRDLTCHFTADDECMEEK
jgi:hypothetical protein